MTGTNDLGLKKIMDLTRVISVVLLLLHFYFFDYRVFFDWGLTAPVCDRILSNLAKTGLFDRFSETKLWALGALFLALLGTEGSQSVTLKFRTPVICLFTGLLCYFSEDILRHLPAPPLVAALAGMGITLLGYLLVMKGGGMLTRIVRVRLNGDVFNRDNETFPQEERLIDTADSLNFRTRYKLRGKTRRGWINVINVYRGLLVSGLPGSGKTLLVKEIIHQQIKKQFSMLVYDFKFPDLTLSAYHYFLRYRHTYPIEPKYYLLNFEQPFHRCNPLAPQSLVDINDAAEASRTLLLGLNHEWIGKQGDFWIESPINFLTAIVWFLRKFREGRYCTLPHVIELLHTSYDKLFTILASEPEVTTLVQPFITAYQHGAMQQLEGQTAGAKISLGRLSSPNLYFVLSGNDFTMDIGNPDEPKIVCMASNPSKTTIYGSVISLYLTSFQRLAAKTGNRKSSLILEEFPTVYFNGIDRFMAVCRSYQVATTLVIQDASQLKLYYGKQQAEVILDLVGNFISGQVTGESTRLFSQRFGRIMQERNSVSLGDHRSVSVSGHPDDAIPQSTIASLSAGEVVGTVADNPDQPITQKMFHGRILHDFGAINREQTRFEPLPANMADPKTIYDNYLNVKAEIRRVVEDELERITNTPELKHLVIKKSPMDQRGFGPGSFGAS